ncbi:MAG: arginine deiminase family protein [Gemmatimonadota bacterium]|jgi:N-dimethylarginine dimethylaminohydrolase
MHDVTAGERTTLQSDVGRMRRVLLKHARSAFVDAASVARQWEALGYLAPPDVEAAERESDAFAGLLERLGVRVTWMPSRDVGLDSIYVRDASVICDRGAILCSMGKEARREEPPFLEHAYRSLGVPVAGAIAGDGRLEGGDVTWLGSRTVAVGRGYRTNDAGIEQLTALLGDAVDEVLTVPLPHWKGPSDVFHLMSVISPLAADLAVVYSPLLPVPFREALLDRGMELVEVPDGEFESMGCNVLAVGPRVAVAVEGNPETRRRMEAAGVEVHVYAGREISAKGCGGPTCLTRPLERLVD